jgi:ATP/maltotriose-dependent transcriptional regulator MalT
MVNAQFAPSEESWSRAVEHANRAGDRRDALEGLSWVAGAVWAGPTSADQGVRRCREIFEQAQGDRKAMSSALFTRAGFEACLGHFDEANALLDRARALLEEVALRVWMAGALAQAAGWIELLQDDPAAAERELRRGYDGLAAIGELSWLSTVAGLLAEAIYAQHRYDEAERFTRMSEESAGAEDVYTQVLWRSVRAKCLVRRGSTSDALRLARESVARVEGTDSLHLRWHTMMSAAEVLRLAGRIDEAGTALREAIGLAERKGNVVGARLARSSLERLR